MNKSVMSSIRAAAFMLMVVAFATAPAFAGSMPGVPDVGTTIGQLLQWAGYIAGLLLFGVAGWDFLTHRQVPRALAEVAGGIALIVIGANATAILSAFGVTAALIR